MDLRNFINTHSDDGLLPLISQGFAKSEYVPNDNLLVNLVKDILSTMLQATENKKTINQLQSGGIAKVSSATKQIVTKKQSYCTEFNQMINCILGLLGFEMSRNLFILYGMKHFIYAEIAYIKSNDIKSYDDLLTSVKKIKSMLSLGNDKVFDIVDMSSYTGDTVSLDSNISNFGILDKLIKTIEINKKSNNISNLPNTQDSVWETLNRMMEHLHNGIYYINNIDELCVCMGDSSLCYEGSFLKLYEMMYKECFTDVPYELWYQRTNHSESSLPFVRLIKDVIKVESFSYGKYAYELRKYFQTIAQNTYKSIMLLTNDPKTKSNWRLSDILLVELTEDFYDNIVNITLNLFIMMSKNIAISQLNTSIFGKSTRIQMMQVFNGLVDCVPRGEVLTESQREILHFVMMTGKIWNESISIVKG